MSISIVLAEAFKSNVEFSVSNFISSSFGNSSVFRCAQVFLHTIRLISLQFSRIVCVCTMSINTLCSASQRLRCENP